MWLSNPKDNHQRLLATICPPMSVLIDENLLYFKFESVIFWYIIVYWGYIGIMENKMETTMKSLNSLMTLVRKPGPSLQTASHLASKSSEPPEQEFLKP